MDWIQDPRLWTFVGQLLTNHRLRREVLQKGVNSYLKEQGVDISPVEVDLDVDEAKQELFVRVKNSGDNFKGTLRVEMT